MTGSSTGVLEDESNNCITLSKITKQKSEATRKRNSSPEAIQNSNYGQYTRTIDVVLEYVQFLKMTVDMCICFI